MIFRIRLIREFEFPDAVIVINNSGEALEDTAERMAREQFAHLAKQKEFADSKDFYAVVDLVKEADKDIPF